MRFCKSCNKWIYSCRLRECLSKGHFIDWNLGFKKEPWNIKKLLRDKELENNKLTEKINVAGPNELMRVK